MADDDFVAVFRLVRIGTVNISAERCLNSCVVLKNLQTAYVYQCHNNQSTVNTKGIHTLTMLHYRRLKEPPLTQYMSAKNIQHA